MGTILRYYETRSFKKWILVIYAIFIPILVIIVFKGGLYVHNTPRNSDVIEQIRNKRELTCNLVPVVSMLRRLHLLSRSQDPKILTSFIKGRKNDKSSGVEIVSIGQSSLPEACMRRLQKFSLDIYSVFISNNVDVPYIQVVAPPGVDLAVSGQVLLKRQPWDVHVTSIFNLLRKQSSHKCLVIDAGANIGASITLPALASGCKVIAFELQSRLRDMIKMAAILNDFDETELVLHGPIATEKKKICYTPNSKHFAGLKTSDQENAHKSSRDSHLDISGKSCELTQSLESVLVENFADKVMFMKLDVDGPEIDVLNSLGTYLRYQKVENFVIEMSLSTNKDILDLLHFNSYRCMQLCSYTEYSVEEYQNLMEGFRADSEGNAIIPPCNLARDAWCWE